MEAVAVGVVEVMVEGWEEEIAVGGMVEEGWGVGGT